MDHLNSNIRSIRDLLNPCFVVHVPQIVIREPKGPWVGEQHY